MNAGSRPSLSELKVGIFMIFACTVLAIAIFTIGAQVGMFEKTFLAKTYLNNVSGLKPGDVVTLAGVEVGNVQRVVISNPGDPLPDTQLNQSNLAKVDRFVGKVQLLQQDIPLQQEKLRELKSDYEKAIKRFGTNSSQAVDLEDAVEDLEDRIESQIDDLEDAHGNILKTRANLQNVVVSLQIQSEYRDWIKNDSSISLGSIGLLGDKYIEISLGRSQVPPPVIKEGAEGWLGTATKEVVVITGTVQSGFRELLTGANDVLANAEVLARALGNIMDELAEGRGTMGKFVTDPSFYNNLDATVVRARQTVEQAAAFMQNMNRGKGTVPRLIQEREIYDRIKAASQRLDAIMARVEQGEGTLGKFVNDPSLYQKSEEVMGTLHHITARINSGEGTLGKLSKDDRVYEDLHNSLAQLSTFLDNLQQGQGTLGRLAKDEQLYQNLNQVSSEVVKLIYDFRQNPKKFLTIKFKLF